MPEELWLVNAKLAGAFRLSERSRIHSEPLFEGLSSIALAPEFDDTKKWTGLHRLEAELAIQREDDDPLPNYVVYQNARDLVHNVVAIVALGSGQRVRVEGSIVATIPTPGDPPVRRGIVGSAGDLIQPTKSSPFPADLLGVGLDSRLLPVIRWWARAIATDDPVDKLIALNSALDMLTGSIEGAPSQTRTCLSCGATTQLKAGQRARNIYFLTKMAGLDDSRAEDVCQSRIDLAHGSATLSHGEIGRMDEHASLLSDAIRVEVGRRLNVDLPKIPASLRVVPEGMLMEVVFPGTPPPRLAEECGFAVDNPAR